MTDIQKNTAKTLEQVADIVAQLKPEQYGQALACLQENSLGRHVRHIIEFFECLVENPDSGEVNYDLRQRKLRLETEPPHSLEAIRILMEKLPDLKDGPMTMKADFGSGIQTFQSSMFRELAFTMDHCIHHLALIRIGISEHFPDVNLDNRIGVAYSTLQYQKENPS